MRIFMALFIINKGIWQKKLLKLKFLPVSQT